MTRYSIVVLAHSDQRQLLRCLLALRQHTQAGEVLLIEPEEVDLSRLAAISQLPLRRIRVSEPCSLGAAYNCGLDLATFDEVLLLHRATLQSDAAEAVEYLASHSDLGVIGAKLFAPGPVPRRVWHAGYSCGCGRVVPVPVGRGEWDRFREIQERTAVSAACMLVRRTDVRFDERYWFRFEDLDFCFQYGQRGYRTVIHPTFCATRLPLTQPAKDATAVRHGARLLASGWLYHQRWCSEQSLPDHPRQLPVRGDAARAFLLGVDAPYLEYSEAKGRIPSVGDRSLREPRRPLLDRL